VRAPGWTTPLAQGVEPGARRSLRGRPARTTAPA